MSTETTTQALPPSAPLTARVGLDQTALQLIALGQSSLHVAEAYEIDSPDMAQAAADERRNLKTLTKRLDDMEKAITRPALEIVETARSWFRPAKQALERADALLEQRLVTWTRREEERVAAERRAAEEAARKARQEAEAKSAAELARAEAIAAERRQQAEEAARRAQEANTPRSAAAAAAEAARLEEEAKAALERGAAKAEAAHIAAAAAAATTQASVQQASTTLPRGTHLRDNWIAVLEDKPDALLRLVRYVAANPQFLNLLTYDEAAGKRLAAATKGALTIDGLVIENRPIMPVRRKP